MASRVVVIRFPLEKVSTWARMGSNDWFWRMGASSDLMEQETQNKRYQRITHLMDVNAGMHVKLISISEYTYNMNIWNTHMYVWMLYVCKNGNIDINNLDKTYVA